MVTVIRPQDQRPNTGGSIGRAISEGFTKGAGQALDFSQQQRNVNRVLKPLEALMNDPNATADQRAMAMLRASTVVPAAANLIPYYMGQSASKSGASTMTGPGGKQLSPPTQSNAGIQRPISPSSGSPAATKQSPSVIDNQSTPTPAASTPTSSGDRPYFKTTESPTAPGIEEYTPNQYSAEESLQLYNKDRMENPMAAEANAAARTAFNAESIRQTNNLIAAQKATLGKNKDMSTWLDETFPNEFQNNSQLKSKALKEIEENWTKEPLTTTQDRVDKWLKPIRESIETFKSSAKHPFFKRSESQKEILRKSFNNLKDSGLEATARLALANGGNGEVEDAEVRDPLSKSVEKILDKIGMFVNEEGVPSIPLRGMLGRAEEARHDLFAGEPDNSTKRKAERDKLSDSLYYAIKEDANLILLRRRLKDHGLGWREAGMVISDAADKANRLGYQLSNQQNTDLSKLAYEPLGGNDWFKRMLNNIFFEAE